MPRIADGRQTALWDETAELSHDFYEALRRHPVPVSEAAIRAIQNSSAVIDVYIWLCYRLRDLKRPTDIPWPALYAQFGSEYKTIRQFRAKFKEMLAEARAVYPGAEVEVMKAGLRLHPSVPAVQPVLVDDARAARRTATGEPDRTLRLQATTVSRFRELYPGLDVDYFEQRWRASQAGRLAAYSPDAQFLAWMAASRRSHKA